MDTRSLCPEVVDCASVAIFKMISAGAELARLIEECIVRVWYKSLESSFSCLKTFGSRLAPNTTQGESPVTHRGPEVRIFGVVVMSCALLLDSTRQGVKKLFCSQVCSRVTLHAWAGWRREWVVMCYDGKCRHGRTAPDVPDRNPNTPLRETEIFTDVDGRSHHAMSNIIQDSDVCEYDIPSIYHRPTTLRVYFRT